MQLRKPPKEMRNSSRYLPQCYKLYKNYKIRYMFYVGCWMIIVKTPPFSSAKKFT